MKVLSVNIGKAQTITWRGKQVKTGIYKYPVQEPLFLGLEDVVGDSVVDRKYHGGIDKACYLFSEDHYARWKMLYPELDWQPGMFGENLTVAGLNEQEIFIGDIYEIGSALVQVTQPRQPCFKLGVRFGSQKVLREFIEYGYAGVYVRVLQKGKVSQEDQLTLIERKKSNPSIFEIFKLLYTEEYSHKTIELAANTEFLAASCKRDLLKKL